MTDFFWVMSIPRRISDVIFLHIGAWDMIGAFHLVYFTQGHTPFGRWWFLGIDVLWRRLDSFHIRVRDMIGWFLWCVGLIQLCSDYRDHEFDDDWFGVTWFLTYHTSDATGAYPISFRGLWILTDLHVHYHLLDAHWDVDMIVTLRSPRDPFS